MVLGLSIVALTLYRMLKWVFSLFFGKVKPDQSGYEEGWFGKGPRPNNDDSLDTSIRSFKIHVPNEVLADLQNRLQNVRYESPVEDSKFHYGFNTDYLKSIVEYWKTEYDWRKQEGQLNIYQHFKTCIEGIDVHFVHVKPNLPEGKKLKVIPILVTHGWPGSFYEFYKMIPLLTTPSSERDFVFEVVCPSIPGYGFSEAPHQKSDWSACEHVFASLKGWNLLKGIAIAYFPSLIPAAEYKAFYPFMKKVKLLLEESGYFHMQSTKPDTVGCALADSPVGLAAYILEKFSTWTDPEGRSSPDGNLTKKFTLDELLTNVMIYWVNNNITSSVRFYKENIGKREHEKMPIAVPCGVALFPNELLMLPRTLLSRNATQLVSYTVMPSGGHFAAFEEPQLLADDVWKFVSLVEKMK